MNVGWNKSARFYLEAAYHVAANNYFSYREEQVVETLSLLSLIENSRKFWRDIVKEIEKGYSQSGLSYNRRLLAIANEKLESIRLSAS